MKNLNSFEGKEISVSEQNQVEGGTLVLTNSLTGLFSNLATFLGNVPVAGTLLTSLFGRLASLFGRK